MLTYLGFYCLFALGFMCGALFVRYYQPVSGEERVYYLGCGQRTKYNNNYLKVVGIYSSKPPIKIHLQSEDGNTSVVVSPHKISFIE